jgi:predicted permease
MATGSLRLLVSRIVALFTKRRRDAELNDEIQAHLESLTDENVNRGMSIDQARAAARREFGGVGQVKESYRDQRGFPLLDSLTQDVRHAVRTLRKSRGFALAVVGSLALGIGANTAIFSLLDAVLLKSLPVPQPRDLHLLINRDERSGVQLGQQFSYPIFQRFGEVVPGARLAAMSRVASLHSRLASDSGFEEASGQLVSGEYFSTLGVQPALGRMLMPDDNRLVDGHSVAVISHGYWQRRFGGLPSVIGRQIELNRHSFTIVGVGPRSFAGVWVDAPVDVWMPLMMQHAMAYSQNYSAMRSDASQPWVGQPGIVWLDVVARATADERDNVRTALDAVFGQRLAEVAQQLTDATERQRVLGQHLVLRPFGNGFSALRRQFETPLLLLMGMVACVLLVACANVANLLLARSAARNREIAVRLSLGASRIRVIRHLLTESIILAVLGGLAGVIVAQWTRAFLIRMALGLESAAIPPGFELDARVFAFASALSLVTGMLFGFAPAVRATSLELGSALKIGSQRVLGRRLGNGMRPLVVLQVAIALVLVVGASLFTRSFKNLVALDPGFERDHVVNVWISPRIGGYSSDQLPALYRRLVERVERIPGVQSASVAMCGIAANCRARDDGIEIAGYHRSPGERIMFQQNRVGLKYFATVGMRVVRGRDFEPRDNAGAPRVAIINETAARRYFPEGDAVGRRFGSPQPDTEIVGIVQDARVNNLHDPAEPMAFYPMSQTVVYGGLDVRTASNPHFLIAEIRQAVGEVDPNLPITRITTLAEQTADSLTRDQLVAYLASGFGMVALGLSCIGLYGVMSYVVTRRTSELGIRMALGASQGRVRWMVFQETLVLIGCGLAIGLPVVFALLRVIEGLLFGLTPHDPATIVPSVMLVIAVAMVAVYLPARRASRIEPLTALRHE